MMDEREEAARAAHSGHSGYHENDPNNYKTNEPFEGLSTADFRVQGSAKELRGDVILIGVYVETPKDPWKKKDVDRVEKNMEIAARWLEDQAAANGVDLTIHFGEPNTIFHIRDDIISKDATNDKIIFTFNKE
ncbi:hypothetical protein RCJ22_03915, partial [Vibrio sp. FNV 38]|nr:hypothetical protein [Vibrio sp. FNV 38]